MTIIRCLSFLTFLSDGVSIGVRQIVVVVSSISNKSITVMQLSSQLSLLSSSSLSLLSIGRQQLSIQDGASSNLSRPPQPESNSFFMAIGQLTEISGRSAQVLEFAQVVLVIIQCLEEGCF